MKKRRNSLGPIRHAAQFNGLGINSEHRLYAGALSNGNIFKNGTLSAFVTLAQLREKVRQRLDEETLPPLLDDRLIERAKRKPIICAYFDKDTSNDLAS